tara:strand:+ start:193 stop:990 length:798 start_codon:yes stop_codon:yes gene_type:complete
MQSLYGAIANYKLKKNMISVDTIYQRVLALANKEQRGYITPQEFNLYANHAQKEIYEQYFFDLEQYKRTASNNSDYSDRESIIHEKLAAFRNSGNSISHGDAIVNNRRIADVILLLPLEEVNDEGDRYRTVERMTVEDRYKIVSSLLLRPNKSRPVYWLTRTGGSATFRINFQPEVGSTSLSAGSQYKISYYEEPEKVNWTYVVVNEKPLYNPSAADFADFQLHSSEETKLVNKILQLAGIGIKDYNITQVAAQKEAITTQQEKQ